MVFATTSQQSFCVMSWRNAALLLVISTILFMWAYNRNTSHNLADHGKKSILLETAEGEEGKVFDYFVIKQLQYPNFARMSAATDPSTRDIVKELDMGLFHIVTTFVPFDHEEVSINLMVNGLREPTQDELQARMAEVTECLQKNLNHKLVVFVHVLVLRSETINYLQMLDLRNSEKMVIHQVKESPTMKHEIMYASKYLRGKSVIVTHQDNYLGKGWEKVNHKHLRNTRLMYALTRHNPPSHCPIMSPAAHCDGDFEYVGSHDTFVFFVREAIRGRDLVELDVTPNTSGIENVLMWIFRKRLGYKVINPCKVLFVYHNHCVPIREVGRERINIDKTAMAYFTDQLT